MTTSTTTPSLSERVGRFWKRIERVREAFPSKDEVVAETRFATQLAWPMMLSNATGLGLSLINVAFVGHLGQTELAAAALGAMIINMCWSGAIGVLCAIDTLASQAHGAGNSSAVGTILQRGICIVTVYAVPVAFVWWYSGSILLALGQSDSVSRLATFYCRALIPAVIPMYMKEALNRTLVATGIVKPQLIVGICCVALAALLDWLFIIVLRLGFIGAPIALGIIWALQGPLLLLSLLAVAVYKEKHRDPQHQHQVSMHRRALRWIWPPRRAALHHWGEFLKLALPGVLMIAAEWTAWEICALFAGMIGEAQLAAYTVNYSTMGLCFMVPLTFGVVSSARVGNNLGAGRPALARFAAFCCISKTVLLPFAFF